MSVFPVFAWKAQTYRVQNISVSVLMIMMRAGKFLPTPRKRNTPYCDCEFRTEKEKKRLVYWKNKKTKGKKKKEKTKLKNEPLSYIADQLESWFLQLCVRFPKWNIDCIIKGQSKFLLIHKLFILLYLMKMSIESVDSYHRKLLMIRLRTWKFDTQQSPLFSLRTSTRARSFVCLVPSRSLAWKQ